jgi:arginyl-tRNA synthetase
MMMMIIFFLELAGLLVNGVEYKVSNSFRKVVVDFSSPNVAKEMHVGHLRSTIIGETTARILEFAGYHVLRFNHIGDWGTQFGMLIEFMMETYPDFMTTPPPISDLQSFYKLSKAKFDSDDAFKLRSQQRVVKLQRGDEFSRAAWKMICDISRTAFSQIYDRLDITIFERGESYYNDLIPPMVKELKDTGLIVESKGAQCIFTNVDDVPLMVVKSDGGFGYDSTDLAAVHDRLKVEKAAWVIYVTDIGQESHFLKIFEAARLAGWHVPPATRLDHMGFGLVCGEDGKKFKTRSGNYYHHHFSFFQATLSN